ncbi:hypothetical protein, partial [Corallococcus praedator]|uniref:hypothetical protein n=1 Tax=Corallococcus praedator TaxID=2316724 RepID=UPI001ABFBF1C
IWWMLTALFATLWSALLAVLGAIAGVAVGYVIAFYTSWGTEFADWLSQLTSGLDFAIETDLLIFALAGWGTAWGLTAAGGLGQRRRWWSGAIGSLAYLIGWLSLQSVQIEGATAGFTVFAAIAPPLLVLGLGMTSDSLMRAIVAIVGITPCIAILA